MVSMRHPIVFRMDHWCLNVSATFSHRHWGNVPHLYSVATDVVASGSSIIVFVCVLAMPRQCGRKDGAIGGDIHYLTGVCSIHRRRAFIIWVCHSANAILFSSNIFDVWFYELFSSNGRVTMTTPFHTGLVSGDSWAGLLSGFRTPLVRCP